MRASYLGFIVVRPLPVAIVGRTVLLPYPSDGGRRRFTTLIDYPVNLFGIHLKVRSLGFQEQDKVIAACATVALWSCFQKTAELFGTAAPRPALITQAASKGGLHIGRNVPSRSLNLQEMCRAINYVGLEPEVIDLTKQAVPLVSCAYGYLRFGIPVILIVNVPGGEHAITLTGYSIRSSPVRRTELPAEGKAPSMVGLRIDEFYGHDDQTCPFSRLTIKHDPGNSLTLETSWEKEDETTKVVEALPRYLVIPVYNKIRLTFIDVQQWIEPINNIFEKMLPSELACEWDVRLMLSNDYKGQARRAHGLDSEYRRLLLLTHHPRFIWVASLFVDGLHLVDFLFDATGIAKSLPIYHVSWRDHACADALSAELANDETRKIFVEFGGESLVTLLSTSLEDARR